MEDQGSSSEGASVEMPPELSLRLFKEGAMFVFLDVPPGTEIGIDMESWNTGERFKGIKMIPPGLHFIYFSAVSKDLKSTAPRTGFYHFFQKRELLAKKYDPRMEDILVNGVTEEARLKMQANKEDLDRSLGAYPYSLWRRWISLTNRITNETLERLSPPSGRILSAPELTLDADQTAPPPSKRKMTQLEKAESCLPKMTENFESKIKYTKIPQENYPEGATPQQISKLQLDKSWKLQKALDLMGSPAEYLAEVQFSFVTFLVGQHYDSFEHWKCLVQLLCHSDEAVLQYPSLFIDFVSDLFFQIKEIPEDFFVDIVTSNNFLFNCMQRLINNIKEHEKAETKLRSKIDRFAEFLSSKFGWDFGEEYDDAPTIVDAQDAVISTDRVNETDDIELGDDPASDNELELESIDTLGELPIF